MNEFHDYVFPPCLLQSFRKMFGEEFLESVDEGCKPHSEERPETSESPSIVLEARGKFLKHLKNHYR